MHMRKVCVNRFSLLSLGLLMSIYAQLPPKPAYPFGIKQPHCGHSLTDPLFYPWPGQFVELVVDINGLRGWQIFHPAPFANVLVGKATLPGAWIRFHWDQTLAACNPNCYDPNYNPRYDIDKWELLIITENYQGVADFTMQNTHTNLLNFVQHAWQNGNGGNGTPVLLWTN